MNVLKDIMEASFSPCSNFRRAIQKKNGGHVSTNDN